MIIFKNLLKKQRMHESNCDKVQYCTCDIARIWDASFIPEYNLLIANKMLDIPWS